MDGYHAALNTADETAYTAEVEALPIVKYLRARDAMQEQRFSLAMEELATKDQVGCRRAKGYHYKQGRYHPSRHRQVQC
ncbi:MAG: hypothetical protein MZV70_54440 [Desulfobacterales bacterium]|nr:hypothetical protein [Desulfobacterales bacterium]